ncbi:MAG: ribosomal protein S18-alanine N-acetyltransferase [Firmicutes bacterium]|nr:ribosomal protein S18-alanine N-acetyltransferase [Bacillota bacterium]
MTIRKLSIRDIDDIMAIERVSFPTPWSRHAFVSELSQNPYAEYYGAVQDGRLIGYGGMWLILDEAHVTNIAVLPQYRRRGVGEVLLKVLMEKAGLKGADWITLEVRESNLGAQRLYQKHGFSQKGLRRGYYTSTKEDAIIMSRSLRAGESGEGAGEARRVRGTGRGSGGDPVRQRVVP